MAYTRPTLAAFTAIFADFVSVSQAQFDYWIARAERSIGVEFGDDQLHATQLYTAHLLAMQGLGDGIEGQRIANFGGANSVKSDGLALGWSDGAGASSIDRAPTRYWLQLRPLLLAVKGGPLVGGTGSVPVQVRRGLTDGLA